MEEISLVDCHCHLDGERYVEDLDEVVKRAEKAGLKRIICSGTGPKSNRAVLELTKKYSLINCTFGIYPVDAVAGEPGANFDDDVARDLEIFDVDKELAWIEEHAENCVGIGEAGLDFKLVKNETLQKKQEEIFSKVIDLCMKLDKTLVVHSRNGEERAIELMEEKGIKKVMMHCFSGKKRLIKRCAENDWVCSVPAVITRLDHFKMLVEIMPLEQLVTETDSPYLSPVAMTRNEPANVKITISEVAKIKGQSEEEIAKVMFNNAKKLFSL